MPVPVMPDPSIDELWDGLNASNIRLDKVWAGVKEVLAAKMPGMITRYNTKNNRTGKNALPQIEEFHTGGVNLDNEKNFPCIVVGSESEFLPLGPGAQMSNNTTCIWVVYRATLTDEQVRDSSLLAHLSLGVMLGYQIGYRNRSNQRLWTSLAPGAVRAIPKNEKSLYGGCYLNLDVIQSPDPDAANIYEPGI
ncbi:MAG TPA: hypothetical protein VGB77_22185 [Abditibacteriaceae bacterium]|jgi:hypothetical protein